MGNTKHAYWPQYFICLVLRARISGSEEGIPVLIYHQILSGDDDPGETRISLVNFEEKINYLCENGYTTTSMDDLIRFMKNGSTSPKPIVLTFDDGWKSVITAIPILKRYHFKASFFIFPRKGIGKPYMDWADISAIAENPDFQIESHSMTHPWDKKSNLVTWVEGKTIGKDGKDAEYKLKESKKILEKILNKKVRYFAWPVGWCDEKIIKMAKDADYQALLTAEEGDNKTGGDIFRINRIFLDGACGMTVLKQILQDHKYHICQTNRTPTMGHSPH